MYNEACNSRLKRRTVIGKLQTAFSTLSFSLKGLSSANPITVIFAQFIIFVFLCTAYMANSNKYITQGYIVNKFEAERRQLIIENEVANRLVEEAKALSKVKEYADASMVKATFAEYVTAHQNGVAVLTR